MIKVEEHCGEASRPRSRSDRVRRCVQFEAAVDVAGDASLKFHRESSRCRTSEVDGHSKSIWMGVRWGARRQCKSQSSMSTRSVAARGFSKFNLTASTLPLAGARARHIITTDILDSRGRRSDTLRRRCGWCCHPRWRRRSSGWSTSPAGAGRPRQRRRPCP